MAIAAAGYFVAHHGKTASTTAHAGSYTEVAPFNIDALACYNGTNTVQVLLPEASPPAISSSFFAQPSDLSNGATAANSSNFRSTQYLYVAPGDQIDINLYHATSGESASRKVDISNQISGQSINTSALSPCSNKTIVPAYVGNGYTVSPISVSGTISRATAVNCGAGDLCSATAGVTVADTTPYVGGFSFSFPSQTSGFLDETSGGIQPNGSIFSPLTISPSLANGTYSGTSTLTLNTVVTKGGSTFVGPTIDYSITLTN